MGEEGQAGQEKTQRGVQSVDVAGRFLQALAEARAPLSAAELATAVGIAPAQAHPYLVSLTRQGWIKRDHLDDRFEPGPLALQLARMRLELDPGLHAAVPLVAELTARTGCSVAVSVPGAQGPTIVRYERGNAPLHVNLHVGTVMSLATTATGRMYCACVDQAQWVPLFDALPARPPRAAFLAELDEVRSRGIARSIDIPSPGVSSLCAPVRDARGALRLLLTAIGPTANIDTTWRGELARALLATAAQVANSLRGED
ncbi:IclR family transcriptional regulator [Cupriavidus sp. HPC(L)]|uniref:IclR family transcriptional regulator n=1 Tax=Cupriavidus sp. HPC(L) TaxID=1217418 RepID=UPI000290DEE3|nr:helix-turn-helix domain-containing protein [Cupriavidus sp. HPC(L)]ESH86930.1 IclR family transcriptional regulator [Cupriavidus sp. HPC(L)]